MFENIGFDKPADIQKCVHDPVQFNNGPQAVVGFAGDQDDLAATGAVDNLRRYRIAVNHEPECPFRQDPAGSIDDVYFAQIADEALPREYPRKLPGVPGQQRQGALQVARHRQHVSTNDLLMFFQISLGDCPGFHDRGLHPGIEPVFHAEIEENGGEHRDDNCRCECDKAEQNDQAGMQARTDLSAAAFHPQPDQAAGDDKPEQQKNHKVDLQQDQYRAGIGAKRR